MQQNEFLLEEYKAVNAKHLALSKEYRKLENYTIGGTLTVYGILFGIGVGRTGAEVPIVAWWMIFFVLVAAGVRCWSHYIYVQLINDYIHLVEGIMFGSPHETPPGFQTFVASYRSSAHRLLATFGRSKYFFMSNGVFWFLLLSAALFIAILKTAYR
jgi:hypothetical protein